VTELASHAALANDATAPGSSAAPDTDEWKAEFDAQQAEFRARSAVQREKAEAERARWEAMRAASGGARSPLPAEAGPGPGRGRDAHITGHGAWESVQGRAGEAAVGRDSRRASPSPADGRDFVPGEHAGLPPSHGARAREQAASEHSGTASGEGEHSGSEPSSLTGSFPSEFDLDTPPEHRAALADAPGRASHAPIPLPPPFGGELHAAATARGAQGAQKAPLAVTPMVFDASLPPRARALALVAALGINLLLPFVNGVMLGFGEIFAKEVLGVWIGWSRPGAAIAGLGLRGTRRTSS
jgi:hypothetical protein